MVDLKIRGIPKSAYDRQKHLAALKGISLNAKILGLIEQDDQKHRKKLVQELRELREETLKKHGLFPKGMIEEMIREDRENRA